MAIEQPEKRETQNKLGIVPQLLLIGVYPFPTPNPAVNLEGLDLSAGRLRRAFTEESFIDHNGFRKGAS
jgi:hypothetical protein